MTVSFSDNSLQNDGWTYLSVKGNATAVDEQIAYSAGYIEGQLTSKLIMESFINTGANFTWDNSALGQFLANNTEFVTNSIIKNMSSDPFFYQIWLTHVQLMGIFDGYTDMAVSSNLPLYPFTTFINQQIWGDLDDLTTVFGVPVGPALPPGLSTVKERRKAAAEQAKQAVHDGKLDSAVHRKLRASAESNGRGHCSAAVVATDATLSGNMPVKDDSPVGTASEIYFGQTAWSGFEDMLRIWKYYDLPYSAAPNADKSNPNSIVPGRASSFSSYPAVVYSGDDFYALYPSNLAVLETTIGNNNATLYDLYVKADTVLEWNRNIVANRLANDGETWVNYFSKLNSGTYCNEFLVADYKKIKPDNNNNILSVYSGFLYLVDQVPGYTSSVDVTVQLLSNKYVPSYNSPAIEFIFDISNNTALVEAYGPWYSYNETARAQIFAQRAPLVQTEDDFKALMRYNDYVHDPIARQGCGSHPPYSAENAIAARDDLNIIGGDYTIDSLGHRDHAAIDAKITSYRRITATGPTGSRIISCAAQAGPTYDQQPPFDWDTTSPDIQAINHVGQPTGAWTKPWLDINYDIDF